MENKVGEEGQKASPEGEPSLLEHGAPFPGVLKLMTAGKGDENNEESTDRRHSAYQGWGQLVKDAIIGSVGTQGDNPKKDVGEREENRNTCKDAPKVL